MERKKLQGFEVGAKEEQKNLEDPGTQTIG